MSKKKLSQIDEQIKLLEGKKVKLLEDLTKKRIKNLTKLGLFDLDESEMYGLVITALSEKDNQDIIKKWRNAGAKFLSK